MEPKLLTQQEIEDLFFNDTLKLTKADRDKRKAMENELKRIHCYQHMALLWEAFVEEFEEGTSKTHQIITSVVNNHSGVNTGIKRDFLRMLVKHFRELIVIDSPTK